MNLPCIKHSYPCPYADKTGKEREWKCYGVRPATKMMLLKECPNSKATQEAREKRDKL